MKLWGCLCALGKWVQGEHDGEKALKRSPEPPEWEPLTLLPSPLCCFWQPAQWGLGCAVGLRALGPQSESKGGQVGGGLAAGGNLTAGLPGSRRVPCAQGEMSVGEAVPSPSPQRDVSTEWAQAAWQGPGTDTS